ncbi:MAG: sugar phosphate nucleotidyltransferase [Candidatus Nanoarchaeia archaeon]
MNEPTCIYLAAGLSSRFGGEIKCLAKVGKNEESFLEVSMNQAIDAGFKRIIIIVSKETEEPIKQELGTSKRDIPLIYQLQERFSRKKPFGTAHALLSGKEMLGEPALVLNSDDLYGRNLLEQLRKKMDVEKQIENLIVAHLLKNVINERKVNRGIIQVEGGYVKSIEGISVSVQSLKELYSGEELVSMNLFIVGRNFLNFLEKEVKEFIEKEKDSEKEMSIVQVLNKFIQDKEAKIPFIISKDRVMIITYPEDAEGVRMQLLSYLL